ncbi:MAG: PT domain-containing protein [Candidatus Omnitrophica bacterium]|nr:PT domain-containing protein [Candidatus Omnitrophota bacterium]
MTSKPTNYPTGKPVNQPTNRTTNKPFFIFLDKSCIIAKIIS